METSFDQVTESIFVMCQTQYVTMCTSARQDASSKMCCVRLGKLCQQAKLIMKCRRFAELSLKNMTDKPVCSQAASCYSVMCAHCL